MSKTCSKCGGTLEEGFTTAQRLVRGSGVEGDTPDLVFVVPESATSSNPVTALKQGLAGEPTNRVYGIRGLRCSQCSALELFADGEIHA